MTDNKLFEGQFYKGDYNYQNLNGLVLRLGLIEIGTGCILRVIHVAGTRTKRAGIYGLSQGYLLEGMMTGQKPLEFIPLN